LEKDEGGMMDEKTIEALSDMIMESNEYAYKYGKLCGMLEGWLVDGVDYGKVKGELYSMFRYSSAREPSKGMLGNRTAI